MTKQPTQRPPVPSRIATPNYDGGEGNNYAGGAKNHWVRPSHHTNLDFCTYNVRTLLDDDKITELEHEIQNLKWDIIGLSEIRRGEEKIQLNSGHILFWKGYENKSEEGVGFLIIKNIRNNIINFKAINERIAKVIVKLNKNFKSQVIQIYAPTTSSKDEAIEEFYNKLDSTMNEDKCKMTIIMGDFNAKIGINPDTSELCTGKFGSGTRNVRGDRLVEFATAGGLKIANTFSRKIQKEDGHGEAPTTTTLKMK